jgi:DHA2 family multidrug resistance protein
VVAYAAFFSVSLLIPQWLQRDMGYTAIWAGLATAPIGILPVIMTPFVGKYASRFDMRWIASFAFVFLSFTSFLRSGFNLQVDFAHVAGVQLIMGIGVALFFMPVLQILLSDLDGREIAAGSGLATFLRTLGGSFAASLTTWLWARRTQEHHAHLTESISGYTPGMQEKVAAMGQGDLQHGAAALNNMINHQASQMGFNDIFFLLGWIFLAIIAFLWLGQATVRRRCRRSLRGRALMHADLTKPKNPAETRGFLLVPCAGCGEGQTSHVADDAVEPGFARLLHAFWRTAGGQRFL